MWIAKVGQPPSCLATPASPEVRVIVIEDIRHDWNVIVCLWGENECNIVPGIHERQQAFIKLRFCYLVSIKYNDDLIQGNLLPAHCGWAGAAEVNLVVNSVVTSAAITVVILVVIVVVIFAAISVTIFVVITVVILVMISVAILVVIRAK